MLIHVNNSPPKREKINLIITLQQSEEIIYAEKTKDTGNLLNIFTK